VGGAAAFCISVCWSSLADGLDGVAIRRSEGGMDGSTDSGVDGGALCIGAADHFGYESDLLGDGGSGLFGWSRHWSTRERSRVSFLPVYGVGVFGERADGVGGSLIGSDSLGLGCQKIGGKSDFTLEKRGSFDTGVGDELVCGGVSEISRIVELFFGVRVGGAFC